MGLLSFCFCHGLENGPSYSPNVGLKLFKRNETSLCINEGSPYTADDPTLCYQLNFLSIYHLNDPNADLCLMYSRMPIRVQYCLYWANYYGTYTSDFYSTQVISRLQQCGYSLASPTLPLCSNNQYPALPLPDAPNQSPACWEDSNSYGGCMNSCQQLYIDFVVNHKYTSCDLYRCIHCAYNFPFIQQMVSVDYYSMLPYLTSSTPTTTSTIQSTSTSTTSSSVSVEATTTETSESIDSTSVLTTDESETTTTEAEESTSTDINTDESTESNSITTTENSSDSTLTTEYSETLTDLTSSTELTNTEISTETSSESTTSLSEGSSSSVSLSSVTTNTGNSSSIDSASSSQSSSSTDTSSTLTGSASSSTSSSSISVSTSFQTTSSSTNATTETSSTQSAISSSLSQSNSGK